MGILAQMQDELMERKDLVAYLNLRLKQLGCAKQNLVKDVEKDPRQDKQKLHAAQQKVKGRMLEIRKLREHLAQRAIKEESKGMWNSLFRDDNTEV